MIKRQRGEEILYESDEFVYDLLLRKKYVEKLERILGMVRKAHKGDAKSCAVCAAIKELDTFYTYTKQLYEEDKWGGGKD